MNQKCQNFRSFLLEEYDGEPLPSGYRSHVQSCADCRIYLKSYQRALNALKQKAAVAVPEPVSRRLYQKLFKPKHIFRPVYAFTLVVLLLIIFIFSPRPHSSIRRATLPALTLNNVYYKGTPANIYIEKNKNYVNIFITGKEN